MRIQPIMHGGGVSVDKHNEIAKQIKAISTVNARSNLVISNAANGSTLINTATKIPNTVNVVTALCTGWDEIIQGTWTRTIGTTEWAIASPHNPVGDAEGDGLIWNFLLNGGSYDLTVGFDRIFTNGGTMHWSIDGDEVLIIDSAGVGADIFDSTISPFTVEETAEVAISMEVLSTSTAGHIVRPVWFTIR